MPKLKILSGEEVIKIFLSLGFEVASQRGSHVKLRRITSNGAKQTLTIPNASELDRGTLRAIYRQALRYISEQELTPYFYTE
ncbi:MAG: type II toxin-antitoxin system HicA family toxin [Candidatus Giovannonibacteria bacterium]|nr:type II toxin-antitoxin system HicA family toxin [Candidatus Giovannonibacteria bacterium]